MLYTYSMFKGICLSILILVTGCSTTNYRVLTPYEVSIIPLDCFNKKQIVSWMENQLNYAEQFPRLYNENIDAIKYKMWQIRTHCPR
jgi:hypothetical protein